MKFCWYRVRREEIQMQWLSFKSSKLVSTVVGKIDYNEIFINNLKGLGYLQFLWNFQKQNANFISILENKYILEANGKI